MRQNLRVGQAPSQTIPKQTDSDAGPPLKSSEIMRLCAGLTGQKIASTGSPVAGFVPCLRKLNAPIDAIRTWRTGSPDLFSGSVVALESADVIQAVRMVEALLV